MATIKVTQVKSKIGQTQRQKRTLEALGLNKMGATVEHTTTPQIIGMVKKVQHLVEVEGELKVAAEKKAAPKKTAKPKAEAKKEEPKAEVVVEEVKAEETETEESVEKEEKEDK